MFHTCKTSFAIVEGTWGLVHSFPTHVLGQEVVEISDTAKAFMSWHPVGEQDSMMRAMLDWVLGKQESSGKPWQNEEALHKGTLPLLPVIRFLLGPPAVVWMTAFSSLWGQYPAETLPAEKGISCPSGERGGAADTGQHKSCRKAVVVPCPRGLSGVFSVPGKWTSEPFCVSDGWTSEPYRCSPGLFWLHLCKVSRRSESTTTFPSWGLCLGWQCGNPLSSP